MFSRIWSTELTDYVSETQEDGQSYLEIKKVNFFVGANNSGKSRLIRTYFNSDPKNLLGILTTFNNKKFKYRSLINKADKNGSFFSDLKESDFSKPIDIAQLRILGRFFNSLFKDDYKWPNTKSIEQHSLSYVLKHIRESSDFLGIERDYSKINFSAFPFNNNKRYYIPILRGLRTLDKDRDINQLRSTQDYFPNLLKEDHLGTRLKTGHNLYETLASLLLGQPEQRELVHAYQKLLSTHFFEDSEFTLIPEYKKDTIAVKIGDEKQFPIYELGDGLQQIIIITSATYLETEPSMFFIEEPEINLHPGMLRKLIHFLIDHTPHQYFITTHSNHLIDFYNYSDQVTVHRLKKKVENGQTTFTIHDCKQDKDLLQELGVLNTSVYLANSTIWVEGITDRLYLKAYMEKYLAEHPEKQKWQNYSEHIHYAFVEYQGGTLGHWDFNDDDEANDSLKALKLCATPFLIADGDIRSKGNRYQTLIEQLGNNFFITEGKEFENMLPAAILKGTAKHFFHNSRKAKNLQPHNLETINYSDYFGSQEGIGKYLDDLIGSTNNVFSEDSGTIRRKLEFCTKACEYMTKKDETTRDYANQWKLTDELKELCEKIFTHIECCNN